jgi:hypothetical protein
LARKTFYDFIDDGTVKRPPTVIPGLRSLPRRRFDGGIQSILKSLDSGVRRNDGKMTNRTCGAENKRRHTVTGEIIYDWRLFVYPLMVVGYFQFMRYMDMRWSRKRPLTEDELLTHLAKARGKSEYEVFFIAAESWHRTTPQIEGDFRRFLLDGQIPYYVKDYIRKTRSELFTSSEGS